MASLDSLSISSDVFKMIFYTFLCFFVCANALLNLPEGAPCVHGGLKGKCVSLKLCPTAAMVDVPQKRPLPEICSYGEVDPIICCTDCEIRTEDPKKVVVTADGYRFKTGKKAWDECLENLRKYDYDCKKKFKEFTRAVNTTGKCTYVGNYFHAVVYNGENANRREFPHMALVGYGAELSSVQWLCGGSVISKRFLLTAAHCGRHSEFGPITYVAMGILKRTDPERLWRKYKVKRFIPHPEYASPIKYNDIALIETEKRIKFSKDVLPVCLMDAEVSAKQAVVVGWGALGHNRENADTLQKATVDRFSKQECDFVFPVHPHLMRGIDAPTQICYGDSEANTDTCGGDSGGPLQVMRDTTCVSFVVGVTSYGRACGFPGGAGVYTKVMPYLPWIESVVWP